jgi:hypothetical protein
MRIDNTEIRVIQVHANSNATFVAKLQKTGRNNGRADFRNPHFRMNVPVHNQKYSNEPNTLNLNIQYIMNPISPKLPAHKHLELLDSSRKAIRPVCW